jgi:hypothetical protein
MIPDIKVNELDVNYMRVIKRANIDISNKKYIQKKHQQLADDEVQALPRRKSIDSVQYKNDLDGAFKSVVLGNFKAQERLQGEVHDLKLQNKYLQKKLKSSSYGGGQPNASSDSSVKKLVSFENAGTNSKIEYEEISYRLTLILKKMLDRNESIEKFSEMTPSLDTIKELLF